MKTGYVRCSACLISILFFAVCAPAQKFEIDPYAGGFFSGKAAKIFDVKNEAIFGVKAGMYTGPNFEIEGHFGFINDLAYSGTPTRMKAVIWEGLATYTLTKPSIVYGSFGLGGVTTTLSPDTVAFWGGSIPTRDTFISMSYGGGVKTFRKWGPVGYRFDVRGRTLPNYNGFAFTWLEATGGLTFSWSDR
jgi:hypothetical protein